MSIVDSSPKPKTVNLNNGATISTLRSRFGGGSLYLNNGAYVSVADHTDFGFGTGDFTIELWVYAYENVNWRTLIEVGTYSSGLLWRMGTGGDNLYINNSQYNWNPGNVPINSWTHLALVRSSGTVKVFINGNESLSISNGSDLGSSKPVFIGGRNGGGETFNGFIDEIRVTKGISSSRYSSNFDVRTLYAPFPSSGTPVSPPNIPTNLIAGGLDQTINMIWDAPAEDNGGIITDYSIQYSTDGTNWTTFSHSPSVITAISVTGLTNDTPYSVRVGAVNYTGIGTYVSTDNVVPSIPAVDTNPDPYYYSTSLLLHFNGSHNSTTITDTSYLPKIASVQGDAKLSITRQKFGGSSMYFDGSGDYVTFPNHPGFDFYGEDFTVEYWEYRTGGEGGRPVMCRTNTDQGFNPFLIGYAENDSRLYLYICQDPNYDNWNIVNRLDMGPITLNTWVHYAVVRQGNTIRTYQNGTQIGTASSSGTVAAGNGPLNIGRYNNSGFYKGYLDDIRITRGVCRYPDGTSFSVPTLPWSSVAPTITPPNPPTNLSATGGDAQAVLSWTASNSDKTIPVDYSIEYSEDTDPRSWTTSSPNTKLLLHFNKGDIRGNGTVVDYSAYGRKILWNYNSTPARIAGASSPGTYQKFGSACLEVPYNLTGYSVPYIMKVDASSDLNPGSGDYTLEMFIISDWSWGSGKYANSVGRLFGSYNGANGSYFALWSNGGYYGYNGRIAKFVNGSDVYGVTFTNQEISAQSDNYGGPGNYNMGPKHLAFSRQNGVMRIYWNGTKILETADTTQDNFCNNGLVIMGGESGSHYANNYVFGRMDELRYTVGEALYTGSSIDLIPSAEFKNAKIINIPNNKYYVFRAKAENSSGYGDYSSESSSVLVAPPPEITITSEPKNDRILSWNETGSFSITASISDSSSLSYQWQYYLVDSEYSNSKSWQNVPGATSSSLNITTGAFGPYCCPSLGMDPVRCLVTSAYGSKLSKTVRLVNLSYSLGNLYTYPDWNRNNGYGQVAGNWYDGYYGSANERLNYYIENYMYYEPLDNSWFTGPDVKVGFQYSLDGSSWTNVDSTYDIGMRSADSWTANGQTPPMDLSGRIYFRSIIKDNWPYNTNNGTQSNTETSYSRVDRYFWIDMTETSPTNPTNLSATPGDGLVALSWTKGLSGGLPSSTTYTIQHSTDNSNWTTFTDTLAFSNSSINITDLTNSTLYYFRLKVVNSVGETSFTSAVSATPN